MGGHRRLLSQEPPGVDDVMTMASVLIGIPSRDEADTIGYVTRQVDQGVATLPDCLIVNVDNSRDEATRAAFLATPTLHRKQSLPPLWELAGKGGNILTLLTLARKYGARAVCLLDSDVRSISPDWVPRLIGPVLAGRADFVSPRYATSQGGPLRTLISKPVVEGIFLAEVDQPTGGEVALAADLATALLPKDPSSSTLGYGIDIFLTTEAARRRARISCVDLGVKVHRRRPWHTITPIAREVTATALQQIHRYRGELDVDRPFLRFTPAAALPRKLSGQEREGLLRHFHAGLTTYADFYPHFLPPALLRELAASAERGVSPNQWPMIFCSLIRHCTCRELRPCSSSSM